MIDERTKDQVVLDGLLTELLKRLDGAVDFWTMVCLAPIENRHEWLQKQLELFRSLIVVTRSLWARQKPSAEAGPLLQNLDAACQKLNHSFLTLEQFQKESQESIRLATEELAEIYTNLPETISRLGQTIGLEVAYPKEKNPDRQEYFQNILSNLFHWLCQERDQKNPVAVSSGKP